MGPVRHKRKAFMRDDDDEEDRLLRGGRRSRQAVISVQTNKSSFKGDEGDWSEDSSDYSSEDDSEEEKVSGGRKSFLKGHSTTSKQAKKVEKSKKSNDDEETETTEKYRQRTLMIASRGITHRFRHLMNDLLTMMPHAKKDAKLESKSHLDEINEISELYNCNNCVYFEMRKHQDMYLWMSRTPNGPSAKFLIRNVHTMNELSMTGNCLKGSRPILSFDGAFDSIPHLQLLKEMFVQTFGVPRSSRKIKPFVDHVLSFSVVDNKIWMRHYQITSSDAVQESETISTKDNVALVEIGPRCVLDLMRIFDGSFGGSTLYQNPHFSSPNDVRRQVKQEMVKQHLARSQAKTERETKQKLNQLPPDPLNKVFA